MATMLIPPPQFEIDSKELYLVDVVQRRWRGHAIVRGDATGNVGSAPRRRCRRESSVEDARKSIVILVTHHRI